MASLKLLSKIVVLKWSQIELDTDRDHARSVIFGFLFVCIALVMRLSFITNCKMYSLLHKQSTY